MERLAERLDAPLSLIARILLSVLFLMAGLAQIGDVRGFAERLAQEGVPIMLGGLVFWFLILSGLLLILAAATRPVALGQSGFCLASGLLAYGDLAEPTDMTMLLKNISLTGGYLALALHGPGRYSFDAWLAGCE
ncbi:DoxX family protein [Antarcticimicrobium luteum]|uniref:DoxX family protein n=1 Tax=Antarcticimicrobium luteum TaxID=2547397 RepID=A0A4R5VE92_9RHOB|nr:DoxX family protein [Antarcticimicrobium luteum]TDK50693.1 DoxX family protein [Antarcticimicrobium luteum]